MLGWLDSGRLGSFLLQREMRPPPVVVAELVVLSTTEASLVEGDGVVEQLAGDAADYALGEGVLPSVAISTTCRAVVPVLAGVEQRPGEQMPSSEIQGHQFPLHKLFSSEFLFEIPLYQRPYAWTTEEATDLFDDVYAAMGKVGLPPDEISPYFLGSIVLIKPDPTKPGADVVDGQQRLTTLSILLSALRETDASGKLKNDLTKRLYEEADALTGTTARYRVTLRQRDAEFFRTHLQDIDGIAKLHTLDPKQLENDAQRNIRANALLLVERLKGLSDGERQHFARFLLTRCFVIVVSTPDAKSAYRIFSVLNDRGLDLSYTDILKAEVIGGVKSKDQSTYTDKWESIETALGRQEFEQLFAHIRTIFRKVKTRDTILDEIREYVRPADKPEKFLDEVLVPYADALDVVRAAKYQSVSKAEHVNDVLSCLNRIDNTDWVPVALKYVVLFGNAPEKLLTFLRKLERQAAMMMIRRSNVNDRIDRYRLMLEEIEAGRDPFANESPVLAHDAEEREEARRKLDGDIYSVTKTRAFVLTRLDRVLSETAATYDLDKITVEHVLPQSPKQGSTWLEWFPEEKQRWDWVHRLANLTLLTQRKNSEAQNYDFATKKQKYFKSKNGVAVFALTSEVLSEEKWTPAVLETRQKRLLKALCDEWML